MKKEKFRMKSFLPSVSENNSWREALLHFFLASENIMHMWLLYTRASESDKCSHCGTGFKENKICFSAMRFVYPVSSEKNLFD